MTSPPSCTRPFPALSDTLHPPLTVSPVTTVQATAHPTGAAALGVPTQLPTVSTIPVWGWLENLLQQQGVAADVAPHIAQMLHDAEVNSTQALVELADEDFKELIKELITKDIFGVKAIALRSKLATIQGKAKAASSTITTSPPHNKQRVDEVCDFTVPIFCSVCGFHFSICFCCC